MFSSSPCNKIRADPHLSVDRLQHVTNYAFNHNIVINERNHHLLNTNGMNIAHLQHVDAISNGYNNAHFVQMSYDNQASYEDSGDVEQDGNVPLSSKGEPKGPPQACLFVASLAPETDEDKLKDQFAAFGQVCIFMIIIERFDRHRIIYNFFQPSIQASFFATRSAIIYAYLRANMILLALRSLFIMLAALLIPKDILQRLPNLSLTNQIPISV